MGLDHDKNPDSMETPDNPAGYLVCSHCRGYYELQEGESPDDFERCECGNQLEFRQTINLQARAYSANFDDPSIKTISSDDKPSIVKQFPPQALVSKETLINIQEDKWDLWDALNQFQSRTDDNNPKKWADDVIEMDRMMMLVDQKRALEGNHNHSRAKNASQRIGLIGFLSAAIILLIIVLSLILVGELT